MDLPRYTRRISRARWALIGLGISIWVGVASFGLAHHKFRDPGAPAVDLANIAGKTLSLGRNDTYVSSKRLTIPSNLNSGQRYWIGVIIDENDVINENREWNNATYIGIEVQ